MARPQPKRAPKDTGRTRGKKVCQFCKEKVEWIDYKDVGLLRRFMSDRGKIRARRVTGNCVQHQRDIAVAIKSSREVALLPYANRTASEKTARPPRGDRRRDNDEETPSAADQLGVDVGDDAETEDSFEAEVLEDA